MDYSEFTREQLIEKLTEIEMLNKELLAEKEKEVKLDFSWSGNLGHWYWNIKTNSVVFNPLKITTLGYDIDEIPSKVDYQFFTEKLHPEDYESVMDAMLKHLKNENEVYEVEYRIKTKDNNWKWFYDRGKITQRDAHGKPVFMAGIVFDITEKKEQELSLTQINRVLAQETMKDSLTGIINRKTVMEELEYRIKQTKKGRYPLAIAMIDIDKFKNVNDTKGHSVGDKVLVKVAESISGVIRGLDSVGRYGGDEFLVILPNTNLSNAIAVCDRIRSKIEKLDMIDGVKVTISGGVARYENDAIIDFINRADEKLYQAKNFGRNKIL